MVESEQTSVPKLRFPECDGVWEDVRLGEALSTIDAGWSPQCLERPAIGEEWGVLKTTSVVWSGYDDRQNKALPDKLRPRPKLQALKGDILVTRAGPINRVAVVAYVSETRPKLIISDKLMRARANKQNDGDFVARLLSTTRCQNYFSAQKSGLAEAQANISQEILAKVPVKLPSLPEQKKIAAFLGAVDEKLAALRKKRDLLTAYKRGAMQQIFSQKLRFTRDDGGAFPDWKEKRLSDLGRFSGGGTPDTNFPEYWSGDIPWISSSDVIEGDLKGPRITRWVTNVAIQDSATKTVPAGSILIVSRVGVGKLTVAPCDLCTSQDFTNFIPEHGVTLFLAYWMVANTNALLSLCQGTSIKGLTSSDLKTILVPFPHPEEQQKIADFLSALDAKIDAVAAQITQMEAFKKGLLQQMFV